MKPTRQFAYNLLHSGVLALAVVETNGMRVNVEYCRDAKTRVSRTIGRLEKKLKMSPEGKEWAKKYRRNMNLTSSDQLADMLFNEWGYKPKVLTDTGKPATSEAALEEIEGEFVKNFFRMKRLIKARGTYLDAVIREEVGGIVRPFFNLHLVRTFRSSSDNPNFQNIPIRNPEIGRLVRSAFVARPGRRLVEIDYSGIEVRIAACYHKDPVMLRYIRNPEKDMHRDMAAECYRLPPEEVSKKVRYCGKNKFVFPQFYGDWYLSCARALWESIDQMGLQTVSGIPLKEHLAAEGIKKLGKCDPKKEPRPGTFERHIQLVEKDFWGKRFRKYSEWKKKWYEKYKRRGFFDTLTGFRCEGYMKRNDVINYPVQGSAFHCLLWSLIEIQKEIEKRGMKTLIVGQIHDSIVADVPDEELEEYLTMAKEIMTERLPEAWDWINVPIDVEAEVTPVEGSWIQKEEVKI